MQQILVAMLQKHLIAVLVPILPDSGQQKAGKHPNMGIIVDAGAGIVHANEADGCSVFPQRRHNQPLDILAFQNRPFVRRSLLERGQIQNDHRLLLLEDLHPAAYGLRRHPLQSISLGNDALRAPSEGVVPVAVVLRRRLKQISAIRLIKIAHRRQQRDSVPR